ncbi:MAG TPA: DNA-binding domain-containing protein [Gammaproteobacteria bacterium]|nr:DNA-binding domain-containing protein [Gammaproteobacteria bacterium]
MLSLPELQHRFAHALREPEAVELPLRAEGLSSVRRLQVYRNNIQSALLAALQAVYPVTQRLVGDKFFTVAAHAYIRANPSRTGNIQDYGGAFPLFLNKYAPAATLPYLGDMAALEWRRLQTAMAPPHVPMDLEALAAVPAELQPALHFHHQPAARMLCSRFPILSIWEYCQQEEPQETLQLEGPGESVLFARPALDVYMRRLTPGECRFLTALSRGDTFEVACREALEAEPGFDVERQFANLVQEEILTGFYL